MTDHQYRHPIGENDIRPYLASAGIRVTETKSAYLYITANDRIQAVVVESLLERFYPDEWQWLDARSGNYRKGSHR